MNIETEAPRTNTRGTRRKQRSEISEDIPLVDVQPRPEGLAEEKPKPTPYRDGQIKRGLMSAYTTVGIAVSAFDMPVGVAIVENAENCAEAWEKYAKTNPAIRRALMRFIQTSAVSEVVLAHVPIVMGILQAHGPDNIKDKLVMFSAAPETSNGSSNGHAQK